MDIHEQLKELLMRDPTARLQSGGREIVMRCKYCPDSKNPKSAHMGVSLGYNDTPFFFNCFKCHASGIVTKNVLMDWGFFDVDGFIGLTKYNNKILSMSKNSKFVDRQVYKLNNFYISDNPLSQAKLNHINKRLGINLTYDDLLKNKIILNLRDLLDSNNITHYTRDARLITELDQSFIGFISQDNAFINMRNLRQGKVNKAIDKRYVNYNIFGKFNNTERYYTIPTNINLLNPKRIKLNIAEGPFDILSVKYNLRKEEDNVIYSSILGSGYINICKHFINKLALINIEVHIYIDNDVANYVITELANFLRIYNIPLYIHRNVKEGEKDFGVPIERIDERIQRII